MTPPFRLILMFVIVLGSNMSIASNLPPDSTTTVVDKTAAAYLVEEGKTMYNEGRIKEALIKFRQATVKDPNSWKASYWVGKCHYQMNNYGYSLQYAQEAIGQSDEKVDEEIYYLLGQSYHRLGKLDSALVNYELALKFMTAARSKTLFVQHNIDECHFAQGLLTKEPSYKRSHIKGDLNSGYDDYNIVLIAADTMYFTSRRSNTTGGGMNSADQRYFEDTYITSFDKNTNSWGNVTNDLGKINSNGFDALNHLSPDRTWGILTLNTTESGEKKTTRGSDLCEIKMSTKSTWNTPKAIKNKTINTTYFEGSATVTADGNTMYFVTDRKGDKSSTDIYKVEKVGKKWGEAKPLPMNVNTVGRETTPFITPDGRYLFFSSDGHVGMGGLDIYVCENLGETWSTPVNLGYGINTVNNDSHFVYSPELKKAFVSGYEIVGEKSSIDIYELDLNNFVIPTSK